VSKAARTIAADARIALTGTPVENHLDELWALLNLVAPHLLGNRAQFRHRFVRPIADGSPAASARLRGAIELVVLMRKKSQVAGSLPPKIHADLICDLTEEQERLYDRLLEQVIDDGFGSGAQRQTKVLAVLTSLKQVCNHPGLITDDLGELSGRSGKLDLCTDIVANNLKNDSPTLVFTQYRQTGELLVRHFAEQFGVSTPFFHGGLNQEQRVDIVRRVPVRRRSEGARPQPEGRGHRTHAHARRRRHPLRPNFQRRGRKRVMPAPHPIEFRQRAATPGPAPPKPNRPAQKVPENELHPIRLAVGGRLWIMPECSLMLRPQLSTT
jgi:hypothetical protein